MSIRTPLVPAVLAAALVLAPLPAWAQGRMPSAPAGANRTAVAPTGKRATTPATRQRGLPPARMRIFLQITNPDGSTKGIGYAPTNDPLYADWGVLYGFNNGVMNDAVMKNGKPVFNTLSLSRRVDGASAVLFSRLTTGAASNITLVVVRSTPDRIESWKVVCTGAYVTGLQNSSSSDSNDLIENDSITFKTIEWSYLDTDATGKVLNEIFTNWDVTKAAGTSGTRTPTYPGGADSDGDGIPDGWELYYGFNRYSATDALLDGDGDGQNNLQEYFAGTVPHDPKSVLRMSAVSRAGVAGGTSVVLTWNSVAYKKYLLQSAAGPGGPWTTVSTVDSAGDGTTTSTLPVAAGAATFFYRVVVAH